MTATAATDQEMSELIAAFAARKCESVADIGGSALALTCGLMARWDCDVHLIDLGAKGGFPEQPSDWIEPYLAALSEAGAEPGRVHVVRSLQELRPVDMVINLAGFGDTHKVKHLEPLMHRAFHADSRMICDIRKGSGAFPFLNDFGSCEILWRRSEIGRAHV